MDSKITKTSSGGSQRSPQPNINITERPVSGIRPGNCKIDTVNNSAQFAVAPSVEDSTSARSNADLNPYKGLTECHSTENSPVARTGVPDILQGIAIITVPLFVFSVTLLCLVFALRVQPT